MDNKTIEALEKLVQIKDETIKELEKQIQLLKNQSPVIVPNLNPQLQTAPWHPNPIIGPGITPPLYPPYIITSVSGDSSSITLTGDPLPNGSIQSVPNNFPSCSPVQTTGYLEVSPNTNSNITYIQKAGC
jgi:hypothetical protein